MVDKRDLYTFRDASAFLQGLFLFTKGEGREKT